jgi:hypothetical protein
LQDIKNNNDNIDNINNNIDNNNINNNNINNNKITIDTRYRNNKPMVHIPSLYVRMWQCFGIKGYTEKERENLNKIGQI